MTDAAETARPHVPVLLAEVLKALSPGDGEIHIDGTFGAGGYSSAILEAANCRVLALDRDIRAVRAALPLCQRFANRLTVVEAPFSTMAEVAGVCETPDGASKSTATFVDGVVLDIGVSSMQIDQPERGFSFQSDGPLDMRMAAHGPTAADIVNTAPEALLADIFYHLGDERRSRQIARAIVHDRGDKPFVRTQDLAGLCQRVLKAPKIDGRHAATRTFQALRIYVNDELGELVAALSAAEQILKPGGRLVVVTFHSLEDAIVKRFLQVRTGRTPSASRHAPMIVDTGPLPSFRFVNHRGVSPGVDEIAGNPRARSARLRSAIRNDAPAWEPDAPDPRLPRITVGDDGTR